MKHTLSLLLSTALLLLGSCQSDEPAAPQPSGMGSITFDVINYEQYAFDDVTRASVTLLDHLDMAVYDAVADTLVNLVQQKKGEDGYGSFSATLPYGKYNVVFLGYQGSRIANMDSPTSIYFEDDYVPNLFHKYLTLTIEQKENAAQSIVLNRVVAAFTVKVNDIAPSNLTKMEFNCLGGGHRLNGLTGLAFQTDERTYTFDVSKYAEQSAFSVSLYTFLADNETEMNFTVKALDNEGGVIKVHEFDEVPMKLNRITRYSGDFFADPRGTQGFSLSINGEKWDEADFNY